MPKTTKRAATKRAERIAKAHATELIVKDAPGQRRAPGYKPPARGVARYPWATIFLALLVVGLGAWTFYFYHLGPFALPPKKAVTKVVTPASPCLKLVKQVTDTSPGPNAAAFKKIQHTYANPPALTINTQKIYCAGINTNRGLIVLELDPQMAPNTVNNFVFLAQHHFYDGMVFHRVVPKFIIQSGDPLANGSGGPGYKFADEPVPASANYTAGCVAMANSGANTNGSQFFICTADDTKTLQKSYNLFGHVVQGLDVAQKIQGPGDDAASKKNKPDVINHVIVVQAP
jgi:peptidylprolyl isomerase